MFAPTKKNIEWAIEMSRLSGATDLEIDAEKTASRDMADCYARILRLESRCSHREHAAHELRFRDRVKQITGVDPLSEEEISKDFSESDENQPGETHAEP